MFLLLTLKASSFFQKYTVESFVDNAEVFKLYLTQVDQLLSDGRKDGGKLPVHADCTVTYTSQPCG